MIQKFYSRNGNVAIDKLKKVSETGFDWKFGFRNIRICWGPI